MHYLCKRNQIRQQGAIAQLVEQRTENPCVPGSIPGGTTLKKSKRQSLICNVLRIKKTWSVSYFCPN